MCNGLVGCLVPLTTPLPCAAALHLSLSFSHHRLASSVLPAAAGAAARLGADVACARCHCCHVAAARGLQPALCHLGGGRPLPVQGEGILCCKPRSTWYDTGFFFFSLDPRFNHPPPHPSMNSFQTRPSRWRSWPRFARTCSPTFASPAASFKSALCCSSSATSSSAWCARPPLVAHAPSSLWCRALLSSIGLHDVHAPPTMHASPQHMERRVLSQVALKLFFDEALYNVLQSNWPTSLTDAVHLAGLLMQIRYGDHDPSRHKTGFIADALETFVPAHLLHNQLKTTEWEKSVCDVGGRPFHTPACGPVAPCPRAHATLPQCSFPWPLDASTRRMRNSAGRPTSFRCTVSTCNTRASGSATAPPFSRAFWPNTSAAACAMQSAFVSCRPHAVFRCRSSLAWGIC